MEQTIVNTGSGPVRGVAIDGVARYFGIPYAAAPVGANRFRAPAPHARWSEPLDATTFGPSAPQLAVDFPGLDIVPLVGTGWNRGDDFLNLSTRQSFSTCSSSNVKRAANR